MKARDHWKPAQSDSDALKSIKQTKMAQAQRSSPKRPSFTENQQTGPEWPKYTKNQQAGPQGPKITNKTAQNH